MSYNAQMFKLMANELGRIAEDGGDTSGITDEDLFTAITAIENLACSLDLNAYGLAIDALALAACEFGGMYEAFNDKPEIAENLVESLMKYQGFEMVSDTKYTMWVRKED